MPGTAATTSGFGSAITAATCTIVRFRAPAGMFGEQYGYSSGLRLENCVLRCFIPVIVDMKQVGERNGNLPWNPRGSPDIGRPQVSGDVMNTMSRLENKDRVTRLIITPMRARYTIPRGLDETVLIEDYFTDLSGYEEETLIAAFLNVRREWNKASWPPAGFIRKACEEARKGTKQTMPSHMSYYDEADRMMLSEKGKKALREGWGWALYRHVLDTGEDLPALDEAKEMEAIAGHPTQIPQLKELAAAGSAAARGLLRVAVQMDERDADLAKKYLGEEPKVPQEPF